MSDYTAFGLLAFVAAWSSGVGAASFPAKSIRGSILLCFSVVFFALGLRVVLLEQADRARPWVEVATHAR